ncbi:DUF3137 domain-containing protein [Sphingorhabdus arenilitoris]|uniref:DUF3137 domain-containing protein n=1 Tax=Sphingorhabdus arenilitoris TaxID=1490041 RepID=A0ABV8RF96_9SPHN
MIELPDVDSLFDGGLGEWLEGQKAARARTAAKLFKIRIWGVAAAAIVGTIALVMGWGTFGYFAAGIIGFGFFAYGQHIQQQMVNILKQEMNGSLAKALDINYSVDAFPGQEFKTARTYRLLPSHDDSYFQDQWHGSISGTDFLLYETRLTEEQGSGKDKQTVTVFSGIVLRLQFARSFLGTTLVRRDGFKFTLFGDNKNYGGEKLERIKMVHPDFEDTFDVYGNDQVESRYLVHPEYCERLLAIEREFDGSKMTALFKEGDIILVMKTNDMFESASLDPAQDRERLGKTISQFATIAALVKKLNERPR